MERDNIAKLCGLCLQIANKADEVGIKDKRYFINELDVGFRVLSARLRKGVADIIALQEAYTGAVIAKDFNAREVEEMRKTMIDIFGDAEIAYINDMDKKRIKSFVKSIQEEWENEED